MTGRYAQDVHVRLPQKTSQLYSTDYAQVNYRFSDFKLVYGI